MLNPVRRLSVVWLLILVGMLTLSGCATKKYVRTQVEALNPRLDEMTKTTTENAERIDAVDRRAQQGITAAAAADQKATQAGTAAQQAATAAQAADRKADTVNQAVQQTNTRVNTLETRIAGMSDAYTAGEPISVTFRIGSSTLSDEAKSALDQVASNVSGMRSGYMVEIQGFTDNQGSEMFNDTLSQRRAESVLRYLVSKNVPLYRVSIVGLGEANPIAPNNTRAGREQNRRVEVRVLRSASTTTNN